MEVTLPSGNTVTFRDKMMRDDIIAGRRALRLVTNPDGSRVTDASLTDSVRTAVYRQMIVRWSFGPQVPADCHGDAGLADRMLNGYLDEDDGPMLDLAIQPWVEKIMADPAFARNAAVHTATGVRVSAQDETALAALLATGEFTAAEPGPKPASGRPLTAISSSAAPDGLTTTERVPTP